ncbi:hypothetical protein Q1695_001181 [Nippostrongylus brasiliensis]|nr:hypothetical protein Q1695_001181 [Nippostrongylus brasiliensis]
MVRKTLDMKQLKGSSLLHRILLQQMEEINRDTTLMESRVIPQTPTYLTLVVAAVSSSLFNLERIRLISVSEEPTTRPGTGMEVPVGNKASTECNHLVSQFSFLV